MTASPARNYADTIDLADVARSARRGWRQIALFTLAGLAAGIAVLLWAPRRFEAPASLVVKQSDARSSLLGRLAGGGDVASLATSAVGSSAIETEIAILASRTLAGQVIDSLHLKIVKSGRLLDRQDATNYFLKHLDVEKAGGDVVRIVYRASDSLTAAAVPNTLAALYLERRRTTDRGVNSHRVDFLQQRIDSAAAELSAAERNLRREQESSGIIDPATVGKLELERAGQLRTELTSLEMESGALTQLLVQVGKGTMSPRQIAAYPTFIKSSAISQLLAQLGTLEADRLKLLATRTEADPDVEAATLSIKTVEGQLLPIAQSYASAVESQKRDVQRELATLQGAIAGLPRNVEASGRLQRDVLRLSQIYGALQAQLVEARLAAITEGGDVRQLDFAEAPKRPAFPTPLLSIGGGAAAGLMVGVIVAIALGGLGRWARDPFEIERATGLPAVPFDATSPLLIAPAVGAHTILVLPLDARTRTDSIARRLAETASARALQSTVLDLTAASGLEVNAAIEKLEREFGSVIVQLPPLSTQTTAAALSEKRPVVLVASPPRVDKLALSSALGTLKRLEVPCAGIVLTESGGAKALTV